MSTTSKNRELYKPPDLLLVYWVHLAKCVSVYEMARECMFNPYLQKTSSKDSEAQPVQMFGECIAKSAVTACDEHSFPLHLQRGTKHRKA